MIQFGNQVPYQASPEMMKALLRACASKEHVKFLIMSNGLKEREVEGAIESIDMSQRRFTLRRPDRTDLSEYMIRGTFSITDSKGNCFRNEECYDYKHMILERRQAKNAESDRMLYDERTLTTRTSNNLSIVDEVKGSINGTARTFYVVRHRNYPERLAIFAAKNSHQMRRTLAAIDSDLGFWNVFPVLLQDHFMWCGWTAALEYVREEALRIRGDLPVVPKNAEYGEKVAREDMYSAAGLSRENYGVLSGLCFLETNTSKHEAAFAFAENFNTAFLREYLIQPGNRGNEHYGLEITEDLRTHLAHGLARKCPERPIIDHLKTYGIKDIRGFISINGKPFKARSRDSLIEFLAEHITPEVETIVRSSSRVATYEYLPPQGMTYDQLLDLRKEYKIMFEMLSWWFSQLELPPKLHERLMRLA